MCVCELLGRDRDVVGGGRKERTQRFFCTKEYLKLNQSLDTFSPHLNTI